MSGSSKKQTVGYSYHMGLHFGVVHGPVDELSRITVGDRVAWSGSQTASGSITIDAPELFGGESREGGVQGTLDVMMGDAAQAPNAYLSSVQGGHQPAYRGLFGAVFRRGLVSANNPYIKPWAFTLTRIRAGWNQGAAWYPEKASVQVALGEISETSIASLSNEIPPSDSVSPPLQRIASPWTPPTLVGGRIRFVVDGEGNFYYYDSGSSSSSKLQTEHPSNLGVFVFRAKLTFELSGAPGTSDNVRFFVFGSGTAEYGFSYRTVAGQTKLWLWVFAQGSGLTYQQLDYAPPNGTYELVVSTEGDSSLWYVAWRVNGVELRREVTIYVPSRFIRVGPHPGGGVGVTAILAEDIEVVKQTQPPVLGMNPAHIVYQCLTDPEWGMGYSASIIDDQRFRAAADVFHGEGLGLCLHWTQQQPIEGFVQVVMDHAGAVLRQDPRTGLFEIKPLRADYDAASLPVFDEASVTSVDSFERAGTPEAVNEVTVKFDDVLTGKESSVTVQNLAAITSIGSPIAQSTAYPGLPTAALALRVAMRDLRALSTPLARARLKLNRAGYALLPGDVVRLSWPKLGISQIVLRVARVGSGSLTSGGIEVEAVEDVFGLGAGSYVAQQPTGWQEPSSQPSAATMRAVIEAPYYELQRQMPSTELAALPADAGFLLAGAARPDGAAISYEIVTRAAGVGAYEQAGSGEFCAGAMLASQIDRTSTSAQLTAVVDANLIEAGTYALIDGEVVRVDGYDANASTLTIGRGVLDTVAATHAAGAAVLFIGSDSASDSVERVAGEAVEVKLLTVAGSGTLEEIMAPAGALTFAGRAARPYPPGRLRINGQAYPSGAVDAPLSVSWAHRNRLQQNLEGDESGNIGPEPGVTYSASLRRVDNSQLLAAQSGITGTTWQPSVAPYTGPVRLSVWAARGGLESLQRHDVTFTYQGGAPGAASGATIAAAASIAVRASAVSVSTTLQRIAGANLPGDTWSSRLSLAYLGPQTSVVQAGSVLSAQFERMVNGSWVSSTISLGFEIPRDPTSALSDFGAAANVNPAVGGAGWSISGVQGTYLQVTGPSAQQARVIAIGPETSPASEWWGLQQQETGNGTKLVAVTFAGTPAKGDRYVITLGGVEFVRVGQDGDTVGSVAAALAALIDASPSFAATAAGGTVTVDGVTPSHDYSYAAQAIAVAAYSAPD